MNAVIEVIHDVFADPDWPGFEGDGGRASCVMLSIEGGADRREAQDLLLGSVLAHVAGGLGAVPRTVRVRNRSTKVREALHRRESPHELRDVDGVPGRDALVVEVMGVQTEADLLAAVTTLRESHDAGFVWLDATQEPMSTWSASNLYSPRGASVAWSAVVALAAARGHAVLVRPFGVFDDPEAGLQLFCAPHKAPGVRELVQEALAR